MVLWMCGVGVVGLMMGGEVVMAMEDGVGVRWGGGGGDGVGIGGGNGVEEVGGARKERADGLSTS